MRTYTLTIQENVINSQKITLRISESKANDILRICYRQIKRFKERSEYEKKGVKLDQFYVD